MILSCVLCDQLNAQLVTRQHEWNVFSVSGMTSLAESSYINNPALLGNIDSNCTAAQFTPSRFGMKELTTMQVSSFHKLTGFMRAGVAVNSLGGELYNEFSASTLTSFQLSHEATAGVTVQYSRVGIKEYPLQSLISVHAGFTLQLSPYVTSGVVFNNINRAALTGGEQTTPQHMQIGFGAKATDDLYFDASAIITLNRTTGLRVACLYNIVRELSLRIAASSESRSMEAGLHIKPFASLGILAETHYHEVLGITYTGGVRYLW